MVLVRFEASCRASTFGRYPSRSAWASTRDRLASLTFGLSWKTRETRERETPAAAATSSIVGLVMRGAYASGIGI